MRICEVLQILFCIADTVDISYLIQFKISEFQSEIYETTWGGTYLSWYLSRCHKGGRAMWLL